MQKCPVLDSIMINLICNLAQISFRCTHRAVETHHTNTTKERTEIVLRVIQFIPHQTKQLGHSERQNLTCLYTITSPVGGSSLGLEYADATKDGGNHLQKTWKPLLKHRRRQNEKLRLWVTERTL